MITGAVTPDGGEAAIGLVLEAADGRQQRIEAVIDTGLTDWLTLPPEVVEQLGAPLRGSVDVMVADGSVRWLRLYRVKVSWHSRVRSIRAYSAPGKALVGMSLLSGSHLEMEAAPGGEMTIEEMESPS